MIPVGSVNFDMERFNLPKGTAPVCHIINIEVLQNIY